MVAVLRVLEGRLRVERAQAEMHVHGEDLALVEARVGQEEEGRRTSARLLVGNLRSR